MMVCFAEKGTPFHLKWRLKQSALNVILLKRKNTYNRLQNPCPANHHHPVSWHIPTSHSHISVVWLGLFLFLKEQFHMAVHSPGPDWGLELITEWVCTCSNTWRHLKTSEEPQFAMAQHSEGQPETAEGEQGPTGHTSPSQQHQGTWALEPSSRASLSLLPQLTDFMIAHPKCCKKRLAVSSCRHGHS